MVLNRTPDEYGRFHVFTEGRMFDWTLDRIRAHVAAGGYLDEWSPPVPCELDDE